MNIAIVGMGLMGCSMAKGLTRVGHRVYGIDKDIKVLKYCVDIGCIDRSYRSIEALDRDIDLIILAIYPLGIIDYIRKNMKFFKDGTIITDIAGIKEGIVEEIQGILPVNIEFIGGHPMAGMEKIGAYHGDEGIFKGANYIITPTPKNTKRGVETIETIAKDLGFGRVSCITSKKHDEMIAFTSQLTHAIAVALVNSDREEDTYLFTGDSYRELTRIAMINEELWSELFLSNRENLIEKIGDFQEKLEIIKDALKNNEKEVLKQEFIKSTKKRKTLKAKK